MLVRRDARPRCATVLAMRVRRFDDPGAFREAATPYLVRDEARHNLLLGISTTLVQRPDLYEAFDLWVVSEGDDVTAVALRTPSAQSRPRAAVRRRGARRARRSPAPGAAGASRRGRRDCPSSKRSSARGRRRTTWMPRASSATGSTSCARCCPFRRPRDARVPVTPEDRDLRDRVDRRLRGGGAARGQRGERQIRFVESRLEATDDAGVWFWEDGGRAGVDLGLRRSDTERHAHRPRVHAAGAAGRGLRDDASSPSRVAGCSGTGRDALLPVHRPRQPDVERLVPPHRLPDDRRGRARSGSIRDAAGRRVARSALRRRSRRAFLRDHDERDLAGLDHPEALASEPLEERAVAKLLRARARASSFVRSSAAACRSSRASSARCSKYICAGATESTSTPITSVHRIVARAVRRTRRRGRRGVASRSAMTRPVATAGEGAAGRMAIRRPRRAAPHPRSERRRRAAPRYGGAG